MLAVPLPCPATVPTKCRLYSAFVVVSLTACGGTTILDNASCNTGDAAASAGGSSSGGGGALGTGGRVAGGSSSGGGGAQGMGGGAAAAGASSCSLGEGCDTGPGAILPGCQSGSLDAGGFWAPAACALAETTVPGPRTAACLTSSMLGVWLRCSTPSVINTTDDVGIEFDADGTFYQLYTDDGCTMRRGKSFGQTGTWESYDNGTTTSGTPNLWVYLNYNGGSMGSTMTFGCAPRKVRMFNENTPYMFDYVWFGPSLT